MKRLLTFIFLLSTATLMAQQTPPCWFDTYQRQNQSLIQNAETIIRNRVQTVDNASRAAHNIKIIPVVVHVIHNGGVENISDAQIQSQIDVLNEDFRKIFGTNGDGNGVDTEIEFCLAKLSPNGHCTNGIVRVQSTLTNHLTYQRSQLKQLSYWDNNRYLNMYVVKSINGNSGIAGYSSFPGGPPDEDGIVVRYNYFGKIGTIANGSNGRTTTHEISHWFGLYHTFNNGCGTDTCTDGDYICDTPPAANPNYGCPTLNSCSNDFPDLNDQIANYCDYSDDACKNMFTAGQKNRMDATLNTFRMQIWSAPNVTATGCDTNFVMPSLCPPVADFTALTTNICVGSSITFFNRSLNNPTAYNWIFNGGSPSTSTFANPVVSYSSPGTYDVTLIVSDSTGADTLELLNYIIVSLPVVGMPNTWGDNFENGNFPTNGLTIDNPDGGITWERTTDAAYEGIASARIQNLINTNYGQSDALLLPRIDFTALQTPIKLGFKWAYARSDANYSDELIVLISNDCGTTWTQKFYRTGNSLASGPTQTTLFIPDSTQWKNANIDLTTYSTNDHVDIKIVNVTDGGNALYIDSLKLGDFDFNTLPSSVNEVEKQGRLLLFPNPAQTSLTVKFATGNNQNINQVEVTNVIGEKVILLNNLSEKETTINTSQLPTGLYLISVKSGGTYSQLKFIKQ
ncbi:MAG: T9SS type A sorting domain-containing protein [Chitinophagales bacterium]|nr:T9SS type A sorting domain-containing protein [Chitinophagales bacterium]